MPGLNWLVVFRRLSAGNIDNVEAHKRFKVGVRMPLAE
jgi:hypothetical protein